jgi:hypothetical protein
LPFRAKLKINHGITVRVHLIDFSGNGWPEKMPTASLGAQAKSCSRAATKQPAGQITQNPVHPLAQKYSA